MWTHLQPYLDDDLTARSIRRHARIALSRAINLRRLIVMAGSGVTAGYGLPDWRALGVLFLRCTNEQIEEAKKGIEKTPGTWQPGREIQALIHQIERLRTNGSHSKAARSYTLPPWTLEDAKKVDDITVLMDLCTELLDKLPPDASGVRRSILARKKFLSFFTNTRAGLALSDIVTLYGRLPTEPGQYEVSTNESEDNSASRYTEELARIATGDETPVNVIKKLLMETRPKRRQGEERSASNNSTDPEATDPETSIALDRDTVNTIFSDLSCSRVITLNYDAQFERWLLDNLKAREVPSARPFVELCSHNEADRPAHWNPSIEIVSGVRKGAKSVTLNSTNVGELINFGVYNRQYDFQIFHLHGRVDDPENIVLTQRDYQRVYLQEKASRQAFEAAQKVVFHGNDVLMLGIGLSEPDVMRPFRYFATQNIEKTDSPRSKFVLLPSNYKDGWQRKNDEIAVRNVVQYGIYTIFFGGSCFREILKSLDAVTNDVSKARKSLRKTSEKEPYAKTNGSIFEATFNERFEKLKRYTNPAGPTEKLLLGRSAENGARRSDTETCTALSNVIESLAALSSGNEENERAHNRLTAVEALLSEIGSQVRSRALVQELKKIKEDSGAWWDAWRHTPHERRAFYHIAAKRISEKEHYLRVRHCPDYPTLDQGYSGFAPVKKAIEADRTAVIRSDDNELKRIIVDQDQGSSENGRQILRLSIPRGGGTGTFVNLILKSRFQKRIFRREKSEDYRGAFVAHLSFSMEFNSVIKALSRFFARHVAEIQTTRDISEGVKTGIESVYKELIGNGTFGRDGHKIYRDIRNTQSSKLAKHRKVVDRIKSLHTESPESHFAGVEDDIREFARQVYIDRREDEPRLVRQPTYTSKKLLEHDTPREHRLDTLRNVMTAFEACASREDRLFICLSGLDRIVDENGDGYNPAHRALFRMINGQEEKQYAETPNPPMDVLLLSGRPDVPVCYLSEEKKSLKKIPLGDRQGYATLSKTKRKLEKWQKLPPFTWQDRGTLAFANIVERTGEYCAVFDTVKRTIKKIIDEQQQRPLTSSSSPYSAPPPIDFRSMCDRLTAFIAWATTTDSSAQTRSVGETHSSFSIHRLLWNNMALSIWTMVQWSTESLNGDDANERRGEPNGELLQFLEYLDRAAARDGTAGVIQAILTRYRRLDKPDEPATKDGFQNDAELHDLIMRHLVLFALPVEPYVLLGCPLIYGRLRRQYVNRHRSQLENLAENGTEQPTSASQWHERTWMLGHLEHSLQTLVSRHLVIRILPSFELPDPSFGEEPNCGESLFNTAFLHYRFSIHGRLREHLAHKMRMSVLDGGDLNHHRMSIYCDQPNDLPTPSEQHYVMVRDILDYTLLRSRETMNAIYRNGKVEEQYRDQYWDKGSPHEDDDTEPETSRLTGALARRLFAPLENDATRSLLRKDQDSAKYFDANGVGGSLGRIHAVPQRLRGCLSLLQGTFSMGSLSRLESVEVEGGENTPYETYRTWLRDMINLGVMLERSRSDLATILDGGQLDDYTHTGHSQTNWTHVAESIGFSSDKKQCTTFKKVRHPFYRDEIAWLYNERGLASLIQGRVVDALPLLEQARFVMSHKHAPDQDPHAYHASERRIQLNFAVAQIDRGNISKARRILVDLDTSSWNVKQTTPSQTKNFTTLYLALCDHLTGGHQGALQKYKRVIKEFVERRQLRAVSIANRHLGDLQHFLGNSEEARLTIALAVNAASQAEQRDVHHMALVSQARILLKDGNELEARSTIERCLDYATHMGLYHLQINALLAKGHLMLRRGEFGDAANTASEAIALAVRYGLRLRQVSGLVLLAETRMKAGSRTLARSILEETKSESERMGYQTHASRSSEMISQLEAEGITLDHPYKREQFFQEA